VHSEIDGGARCKAQRPRGCEPACEVRCHRSRHHTEYALKADFKRARSPESATHRVSFAAMSRAVGLRSVKLVHLVEHQGRPLLAQLPRPSAQLARLDLEGEFPITPCVA
jgi:hypothetical protein